MAISTNEILEKSLSSQNGTAHNPPPEASSEIDNLLKANTTLAVWLIFFAIGGGMLALYYARIGYLPEIEWKAALVYLFIGSIVGGVIGLLLTISLYLPGVIWSESIVSDPYLKFFYTTPGSKRLGKEPVTELCIQTIFVYLGLPFGLVLLLSHIALLAGNVFYWVFAGGLLILTFMVMRILFRYRSSQHYVDKLRSYLWSNLKSDLTNALRTLMFRPKLQKDTKPVRARRLERHVFKLSSSFTLSVLLNQISMYLIYRLSGSPTMPRTFVALTLLCTGAVWIAAHVVALRHHCHPRQALLASFVAAGLLLFTADNFSSLSVKLMNHFGIGYYLRFNLLINEHGSEILCASGMTKCGTDRLYNVEILSKLGDQYYLKIAEKTYITLPKEDVRTINRIEQDLDLTQPVKN